LISSSSSISIYSSNILIGLDISSPVRREQEHDQEQGQEQEQEQDQHQEQAQEQQQEQEYFPDFFVPRPQSAQVPLERPRIPRLAQRRHRKNMTDMIGTTTAAEFDELPIAVRRKVCAICHFLLPFLGDPETRAVVSEDTNTNAILS
jgi:hypothetical protein